MFFVCRGFRLSSSGPFEHVQLVFIQLSLSVGSGYVLVSVCACLLDGLSSSPAAKLMPHDGKESVKKYVSHLGYALHSLL